MLKASVSLWSADLLNLESEIRRAEPYADAFHIDVADGHYARLLVFFPDIVKAVRSATDIPLEIHLIVQQPENWVDAFADAGADTIVFYPDSTSDPSAVLRKIRDRRLQPGVSIAVSCPVSAIEPYLADVDLVVVLGTDVGVKGVDMPAAQTYDKIRQLVCLRSERQLTFDIEADGAIRRETVPPLRAAGADVVVPGSLMFSGNMKEVSRWLHSL